ncbi:hypothetical protein SO802_013543 [Lithocarpus litseifolius]|uniref:Helicase ATP-binding domain-containing protein n=1 Tax=Lithocarpus litseifolius TaxID=425828 RepID=A0AAW2D6G5_9ROSI
MHDQCLKLAKHRVSACFLGSGQPDSNVEQKAMRGMYSIVYVCPETVLRLIKPLQRLAEGRGIALFAIDEVHCASKWGHDFRPDYRRLSVLRENFSACNLKFLKYDIPLMALTATATIRVWPNLRFSVKHSRTSSPSSYAKDFSELIDIYVRKRKTGEKKETIISEELDDTSYGSDSYEIEDSYAGGDVDEVDSTEENGLTASKGKEMSVEYLENDVDVFQSVDDWDVAFGEFYGQSSWEEGDMRGLSETIDPPTSKHTDPSDFFNWGGLRLEMGLVWCCCWETKPRWRVTQRTIWVNHWGNNSSHSFQPSPFLGLLMKLENLVVEVADEFSGFESNLGSMSLSIGG